MFPNAEFREKILKDETPLGLKCCQILNQPMRDPAKKKENMQENLEFLVPVKGLEFHTTV